MGTTLAQITTHALDRHTARAAGSSPMGRSSSATISPLKSGWSKPSSSMVRSSCRPLLFVSLGRATRAWRSGTCGASPGSEDARHTGRGQRGGASTCRADVRVPVHALARRWESPRWGCSSCSQRSRPSPPDPPIRPPFRPAPRPTPLARAIPIYAGAARRCPRRPATPARADSPRPARHRCTALGVAEVGAGRHALCFEFQPTGMPEPAQATEARAAYSSKQLAPARRKGPRTPPWAFSHGKRPQSAGKPGRHQTPRDRRKPLQIRRLRSSAARLKIVVSRFESGSRHPRKRCQ